MSPKLVNPRWETPDPPGVAGSYGGQVIRWGARKLGLKAGPWQRHVIKRIMRYGHDGNLLARIALISTARQNGKSVIVRLIYGWLLAEGHELNGKAPFREWSSILAAAHDAKQARIIYRGVYRDLQSLPELTHSEPIRTHHDYKIKPKIRLSQYVGIEAPGLLFDTVTSEPGSARGLSAGAIAWDEMLTQRDWSMWEALSPTQSAQRSPIMLLTSTAGYDDSVVLRAFYERLVRQASGDEKPDPTFYGAWWQSMDPDAGLDWTELARANPALGDGRITKQAIESEYAILPKASWRRERLNHFIDVQASGAFHPGIWAANRVDGRPLEDFEGPYTLAVDVQPGWQRATVTVSGLRTDGRVGVEIFEDLRDGVGAERVLKAVESFPDMDHVAAIVYDGVSGIAPEARRRATETALPYQEVTREDFVAACMDVTELIMSARIAVNDPLLDAQMPLVARRNVGTEGKFIFSRGTSLGPIDAFLSMTLGAHACIYSGKIPKIT